MSDKFELISFSTSLFKGKPEYFLKFVSLITRFVSLIEHDMGSHIQFFGNVNKHFLQP